MGIREHRQNALKDLHIGIITLSSSRTLKEDDSGHRIAELAEKNGHHVILHTVIPDQAETIGRTVKKAIAEHAPHALLLNGGTGISPADLTIEAVRPLFQKELTAFGTLFAMLSYEEIGPAAILSRACAGLIGNTVLFCMPGSRKACTLACEKLIFPELGHLLAHMHKG
ncbi:MAG: molybdenum cofactor biosynthesis protein B [Desulfococcaceae bacterium]|jgi:molybdenum cofactor biosynthesis protein B|nr:molybdenum cofactor biosynthesis protein B [Desulfococcaceae bacterium]